MYGETLSGYIIRGNLKAAFCSFNRRLNDFKDRLVSSRTNLLFSTESLVCPKCNVSLRSRGKFQREGLTCLNRPSICVRFEANTSADYEGAMRRP